MFTFQCHEVYKDSNGMLHTVEKNPYLMLSCAGQRLYVQHGQVWSGPESDPIPPDQLPGWFFAQLRAQSHEARKSVGYYLPQDKEYEADQALEKLARDLETLPDSIKEKLAALVGAPRIDEKVPKISGETSDMAHEETQLKIDPKASRLKTWTCDTCGEEMSTKVKGVHLGRLKRLGSCKHG